MLAPATHVPHVLAGQVLGLDRTKVWPVLAEPRDRLALWVVNGDMVAAQLDLAGVLALQALLGEVAAAMQDAGAPAGVAGAAPSADSQNINEINSLGLAERAGFEPAGGC